MSRRNENKGKQIGNGNARGGGGGRPPRPRGGIVIHEREHSHEYDEYYEDDEPSPTPTSQNQSFRRVLNRQQREEIENQQYADEAAAAAQIEADRVLAQSLFQADVETNPPHQMQSSMKSTINLDDDDTMDEEEDGGMDADRGRIRSAKGRTQKRRSPTPPIESNKLNSEVFQIWFRKVESPPAKEGDELVVRAQCNFCEQSYKWKSGNGYGTLTRHLLKHKPKKDAEKEIMGKKEKSSKRKNSETEVVGNEVLLHKSIGDKDGFDVVDDLSEPTMGDKLASLNLEGNDKAPNHEKADSSVLAKPPSADSVNILVKQALHADDRALLIDCLFRQDEKVIANSLALLNPSDVLKLLKSLVPIIQLRGAVLACALPWLRSLLLQHASSIMSQESSVAALNSLFQIIESRISTFNPTLQLSSCLDLLYAESVDDEVEENDTIVPVMYEDESESDDDASEDSMEVDTVEDGEEPVLYSDISDDEVNGEISY